MDIHKGAPLRGWTRNKGPEDKEALAGFCRKWTTSDSETFKAHLIELRGFGVPTLDPRHIVILAPAAVLRLETGERKAVLAHRPFGAGLSHRGHAMLKQPTVEAWKCSRLNPNGNLGSKRSISP